MNAVNDSLEKLKRVFQQVYREKPSVDVSQAWQARVMADVRKLNEIELESSSFRSFENFFWRFSVTGQISLIIVLLYVFQVFCVNTFQMDVKIKQQIAQEFLENPDLEVMPISLGVFSDERQ